MTNQHPITPPPELVQQWHDECHKVHEPFLVHIANQAARWGADMELEACCEWHTNRGYSRFISLREDRRPQPPSLKEQALNLIPDICGLPIMRTYSPDELLIIRRALEALPND